MANRTFGHNQQINMSKSFKILLLVCIALTSSKGQKLLSKDHVNEVISIQTANDYAISGSRLPFSLQVFDVNDSQPSRLSKVAYVQLVNSKNQEVFRTSISLKNGLSEGQIELPDSSSTGIYELIAYTSWMRNFGQSTFGRKPISVINTFEKPKEIKAADPTNSTSNFIEIKLASDKLKTRQHNQISLKSERAAQVSVSIFRVDQMVKPSHFEFEKPPFPERFELNYLPEYEGKRIQGKLIQLSTKKPLPYSNLYISIPEKPVRYFSSQTDSSGHFGLEIPNFYRDKELFFSTLEKDAAIELDDSFEKELIIQTEHPFINKTKTDSTDLALYHLSNQISKTYMMNSTAQIEIKSHPFYTQASVRYDLDNYVRFPTVEDILREFVSEVYVRKETSGTKIQVKELTTDIPFPGQPLVLYDGVPVNDFDQLLRYNPKDLKYLDVLREPYYHHEEVYNGLIAFYSKNGNLPDFKLDQSVSIIDVAGTQLNQLTTQSNQSDPHFPDFRTQLLWINEIKLEPGKEFTLPFQTSEITGTFVIEVKGFDELLNPIISRKDFVVKRIEDQ